MGICNWTFLDPMRTLGPVSFLLLGLILCLGACGKSQDPEPEEVTVVADEEVARTAPVETPGEAAPEMDSNRDIQAEIDALLYDENKEQKALEELLMDPRIMEMMANLFEQDWNPDPAKLERFNQRLMSTMQTVSQAGLTPGVEAPKTNAELDDFMGTVSIGANDPAKVRELLGYVLLQDPEGFMDAFLAMTEDAAIEAVIDPEAKSSMTIQVNP